MATKPRTKPERKPCACSIFSANPSDLTERQLADGDYETWTTECDGSTYRMFAAGHDARLKSFLIDHGFRGSEIHREIGGFVTTTGAVEHAAKFGFAVQVADGITRRQVKAGAKLLRTIERKSASPRAPKAPSAASKASRGSPKAQGRALKSVKTETRDIKVGRWVYYNATVNSDGSVTYVDSQGNQQRVTRYSFV